MFSAYTYNTIRFMGCNPSDLRNCKFSETELKILQENIEFSPYTCEMVPDGMYVNLTPIEQMGPPGSLVGDVPVCPFSMFFYRCPKLNANGNRIVGMYLPRQLPIPAKYPGTLDDLVPYSIQELKQLVYKNHGIVVVDKRKRLTWTTAYIKTILYSFNVFAMSGLLFDDVLYEIRKFL